MTDVTDIIEDEALVPITAHMAPLGRSHEVIVSLFRGGRKVAEKLFPDVSDEQFIRDWVSTKKAELECRS